MKDPFIWKWKVKQATIGFALVTQAFVVSHKCVCEGFMLFVNWKIIHYVVSSLAVIRSMKQQCKKHR